MHLREFIVHVLERIATQLGDLFNALTTAALKNQHFHFQHSTSTAVTGSVSIGEIVCVCLCLSHISLHLVTGKEWLHC